GLALLGLKKPDEALEKFEAALLVDSDHLETLHNQANVLLRIDRFEEALSACDRSLAQKPGQQDVLNTRGVVLGKLGRHAEALVSYDAALGAAEPRPDIEMNRGTALLNLDRADEALACFDAVIAREPGNIAALIYRGNAYIKNKRFDEALTAYEKALAIDPSNPIALTDRGVALTLLDRFEEAVASHDEAVRNEPHIVGAHINRGNAMLKLARLQEALEAYTEALAREPVNSEANFNAAITRLCLGDYREGWKQYEHRWETKHFAGHRPNYPQPMWRGEDITGKRIVLNAEQGMGDVIQFVRYAPLVAARGAEVILAVPRPLKALMATVPAISLVVANGDPIPEFDVFCPLMSLPLVFGTELETVPANIPYLRPYADRIAAWQPRLPDNGRARVGICWAGNPGFGNDRHRSVPLERFAALFEVTGIDFVSLQKEVNPAHAALLEQHGISRLGEQFEDFADTAAVVAMLDLVVAVDTSVAHLAGAMGRVTALLVPFSPDWRWLLDRENSPWYPTMRLFRQTATGDWEGVIERVRRELTEVSQRRARQG
ncbi:MAG: tetratricopeptide repeat protein, partial [Xanthobacteraceae bacterium]